MEIREASYIEFADDEAAIGKIIAEHTEKPIEIYSDRSDHCRVESLVKECKTLEKFECTIMDDYDDALRAEQDDRIKKIKEAIMDLPSAERCEGLSDSLLEMIEDRVREIDVAWPIGDFMKDRIRANVIVRYENSEDAFDRPFDEKTIRVLLTRFGYEKPGTIVKSLKDRSIPMWRSFDTDPFLHSLRREIEESFSDQINELTFVCELAVEDLYRLREGGSIRFPKDCVCGFMDRRNGGGSVMEIELPRSLLVTRRSIGEILIEGADRYTAKEIYGMTSNCYKAASVKAKKR